MLTQTVTAIARSTRERQVSPYQFESLVDQIVPLAEPVEIKVVRDGNGNRVREDARR